MPFILLKTIFHEHIQFDLYVLISTIVYTFFSFLLFIQFPVTISTIFFFIFIRIVLIVAFFFLSGFISYSWKKIKRRTKRGLIASYTYIFNIVLNNSPLYVSSSFYFLFFKKKKTKKISSLYLWFCFFDIIVAVVILFNNLFNLQFPWIYFMCTRVVAPKKALFSSGCCCCWTNLILFFFFYFFGFFCFHYYLYWDFFLLLSIYCRMDTFHCIFSEMADQSQADLPSLLHTKT